MYFVHFLLSYIYYLQFKHSAKYYKLYEQLHCYICLSTLNFYFSGSGLALWQPRAFERMGTRRKSQLSMAATYFCDLNGCSRVCVSGNLYRCSIRGSSANNK